MDNTSVSVLFAINLLVFASGFFLGAAWQRYVSRREERAENARYSIPAARAAMCVEASCGRIFDVTLFEQCPVCLSRERVMLSERGKVKNGKR
jgi:hypothetical protein